MTPAELRCWRLGHGLRMREMARFVGIDESTVRRKEKGRIAISRRLGRLTEMADLLTAAGIVPPGWPPRLYRAVWCRRMSDPP